MKFNTAFVISLLALAIGVFLGKPLVWLPASVLSASIIDLLTRSWTTSDELGRAKNLSMLLKTFLMLIGLYATIGQFVLIGLVIWWFV